MLNLDPYAPPGTPSNWQRSMTSTIGRWLISIETRKLTWDAPVELRTRLLCGEDVHELADPVLPNMSAAGSHVYFQTTRGWMLISKEV